LKKPAGSVRFRFYKQKTEKIEPNRNRQKTEKNRAKPKNRAKTKPNRKNRAKPKKLSQNRKKPSQNRENRAKTEKTEPNRFEPVFALKKPNITEPKLAGLTQFWFSFSKNNFSLVTFF
jgi:hypothetical protein